MICRHCRGRCTIHSPAEIARTLTDRRSQLAWARKRSARFPRREVDVRAEEIVEWQVTA